VVQELAVVGITQEQEPGVALAARQPQERGGLDRVLAGTVEGFVGGGPDGEITAADPAVVVAMSVAGAEAHIPEIGRKTLTRIGKRRPRLDAVVADMRRSGPLVVGILADRKQQGEILSERGEVAAGPIDALGRSQSPLPGDLRPDPSQVRLEKRRQFLRRSGGRDGKPRERNENHQDGEDEAFKKASFHGLLL